MEKELIDVKGMTLHFNLREPRNKYTNIYAVLRLGMRQTKIPMPYKVKSWLWDKKKEIPLTNSEMTSDEIANAKEIYNATRQVSTNVLSITAQHTCQTIR